jgi:hypothetical protein
MLKRLVAAIVVLTVVGVYSAPAHAQSITQLGQGHGLGRPTVSPYMNLLTWDQFGIAAGYQTLVKPFQNGRRAAAANSAAISQLQNQVNSGGGGGGGTGGSAAMQKHFLNYTHYYSGLR